MLGWCVEGDSIDICSWDSCIKSVGLERNSSWMKSNWKPDLTVSTQSWQQLELPSVFHCCFSPSIYSLSVCPCCPYLHLQSLQLFLPTLSPFSISSSIYDFFSDVYTSSQAVTIQLLPPSPFFSPPLGSLCVCVFKKNCCQFPEKCLQFMNWRAHLCSLNCFINYMLEWSVTDKQHLI